MNCCGPLAVCPLTVTACWPWKARPMQFWHDHDRVVHVPALTRVTLIVLDVSQASWVLFADQVTFKAPSPWIVATACGAPFPQRTVTVVSGRADPAVVTYASGGGAEPHAGLDNAAVVALPLGGADAVGPLDVRVGPGAAFAALWCLPAAQPPAAPAAIATTRAVPAMPI